MRALAVRTAVPRRRLGSSARWNSCWPSRLKLLEVCYESVDLLRFLCPDGLGLSLAGS
jgi:hypothetical protein